LGNCVAVLQIRKNSSKREREGKEEAQVKRSIEISTTSKTRARVPEFPQERCQNTDNHVPVHLDALLHFRGAVCMSKLERIIVDPPIDHVHVGQKTIGDADDRWREEARGAEREGGGNAGRRSRRFIFSSKDLDRFMNPVDCSAKKRNDKISFRHAGRKLVSRIRGSSVPSRLRITN